MLKNYAKRVLDVALNFVSDYNTITQDPTVLLLGSTHYKSI